MSKQASAATLLRHARRDLNAMRNERAELIRQRDDYRARATKAEQEAAEWKARFDVLLRREETKT